LDILNSYFGVSEFFFANYSHPSLYYQQQDYIHKTASFCITTFGSNLTTLTVLCCVSRWSLAPPPLWLQKHTDLQAHDFAHSRDLWRQPSVANVINLYSWRLCGMDPAIRVFLKTNSWWVFLVSISGKKALQTIQRIWH